MEAEVSAVAVRGEFAQSERAFTRGRGENAKRKISMESKRGKVPRGKNFFIVVLVVSLVLTL